MYRSLFMSLLLRSCRIQEKENTQIEIQHEINPTQKESRSRGDDVLKPPAGHLPDSEESAHVVFALWTLPETSDGLFKSCGADGCKEEAFLKKN